MNKTDLYFTDEYLAHQVALLRFTSGEQKKVLALLSTMEKELKVKLLGDLTDFGRARVNKLLRESGDVIKSAYAEIAGAGKNSFLPDIKGIAKQIAEQDESKFANELLRTQNRWKKNLQNTEIYKYGQIRKKTNSGLFSDLKKNGIDLGRLEREVKLEGLMGVFSETAGIDQVFLDADEALEIGQKNAYKKIIDELRREGYSINIPVSQSTDLHGLAKTEANFTAKTFAGIGLDASLPTEAALKALVNESLIEGAPSAKWWAKQSDDLAFKFANQVRQGIAQNETIQQIVRRVAGSKKLGVPGIMNTDRRNASALVHTSVMQVSNDARLATFQANSDVIKGMRQLSAMDSHVSKICLAYSGAEWDLAGNPINGNTLPFNGGCPRHFGCRSVIIPITKTFRELGIDVDEPKGTRASDEGQISAKTTMTSFLKSKPRAYVDDLIGPGRAQLFLDGKLTLPELLSFSGNPLTLKQLNAKN